MRTKDQRSEAWGMWTGAFATSLIVVMILRGSVNPSCGGEMPTNPSIHLVEFDAAVMVGRPITIRADVDDPRDKVVRVRFMIDGEVKGSFDRDPSLQQRG